MAHKRKRKDEKKSTETMKITFRCPPDKRSKVFPIIKEALNSLPTEVKAYLFEHPLIISAEFEDFRADAYTFNKKDFGDSEHLIHINHHVWNYTRKEIKRVFIHEIAHIYLGHTARFDDNWEENEKIEEEAESLVAKWIV